jgi:hypothetical protein
MKKILLSVGIFSLLLANISAQRTITCEEKLINGNYACLFSGVAIGQNESISVKIEPEDVNLHRMWVVKISSSSIHTISSEFVAGVPNLKKFYAAGQGIHEIEPDTFQGAQFLDEILLSNNSLSFLHEDTFKGEDFLIFMCILIFFGLVGFLRSGSKDQMLTTFNHKTRDVKLIL